MYAIFDSKSLFHNCKTENKGTDEFGLVAPTLFYNSSVIIKWVFLNGTK